MSDSWSDQQHSASRVAREVLNRYPEDQRLLQGGPVRLNLPDRRVVERSYDGDQIEIDIKIDIDEILGDRIHYPSGIAFMALVLSICEEQNVACNYENLREIGKRIEEALGTR